MKDQIYINIEQLPIEWKTLLHIWFWTALITGVISNLTFILIQTDPNVIFNSPSMAEKELNPLDALRGFGISAIYTTVFMASSLGSVYTVCRWYPWFNFRHLLIQLAVLTPVFFIAFAVAGELCTLLDPEIELKDQLSLTVVGLITLSATIIITLIVYMIVLIRQTHSLQADIAKANLQVLQSQVNPHFLFNTLNTIAALIQFQPKKAETITEDLSDLFRSALNVSKEHIVPLKKELEMVKRFLSIEKARFGDQLLIIWETEKSAAQNDDDENVTIPSFTLQPLVENAIKHGMENADGTLTVRISIQRFEGELRGKIYDSAEGLRGHKIEELIEKGTGIKNVRDRLRFVYKDDADVRIENASVIITYPLNFTQKNDE